MDTVTTSERSRIMRQVKSRETTLEINFRRKLWQAGVRYRKSNGKKFGKPDLMISSKKIVGFIDSCFWHGCPEHVRMPSSNKDYWVNKIDKNKTRDLQVNEFYRSKGWRIIRVWEHELKNEQRVNEIIQLFFSFP